MRQHIASCKASVEDYVENYFKKFLVHKQLRQERIRSNLEN